MINLSHRELSTTLASLRLYQMIADGVSPVEALLIVDEVASDCGSHDPLTVAEIDHLCERINLQPNRAPQP